MQDKSRRLDALLALGAILGAVAVLMPGLGRFGIWDPWELQAADVARQLADGEPVVLQRAPLGTWLLARAFATFGVHEWAGRLPVALFALLAVALAAAFAARFGDRRGAAFAAVASVGTPLMVLHGRLMLGEAPVFATQAAVALTAAAALYRPLSPRAEGQGDVLRATGLWLLALAASLGLAVLAGGVLRGALPPLAAVALVGLLEGLPWRWRTARREALVASVLLGTTALLVLGTALAVAADRAGYSHWTGGVPQGGDPPTFETVLEDVFHGFAPWSALLLPGLARLLWSPSEPARRLEASARWIVVLWAALAYASTMLFTARYGEGTYPAVAALAVAAAWLLRDVERSGSSWWSVAAVAVFFVGLALRDFGLYPASPVDALGLAGVQVPDAFHPTKAWAVVLGLFALAAAVSLGAAPATDERRPSLRAPYELLRRQWRRGRPYQAWLLAFGAVLLGALGFGLAAWVAGPRLGLTTIAIRAGKALLLVVLSLPVLAAAVQWTLWALGRLAPWRALPVLGAGLLVGLYVSHGFLPELSAHYSPKEVYDRYAELARPDEPLGEYRVGGRAAAYYAKGEVRELRNQGQLVAFLLEPGRRWAVFPAEELPSVDRAFRRRARRHLFVPRLQGARVVLVASEPVEGEENHNFLARYVLDAVPEVDHAVGALFDDAIELVGYRLELPHDGYVGAGEQFVVTWVWRVKRRVAGSWKIFLHVDGQGLRLNGDHVPVEEKYPVHMWEAGDVVLDRQPLRVPANFRAGRYTFYIGFFSGERRLPVTKGQQDGNDRAIAGHLTIR